MAKIQIKSERITPIGGFFFNYGLFQPDFEQNDRQNTRFKKRIFRSVRLK